VPNVRIFADGEINNMKTVIVNAIISMRKTICQNRQRSDPMANQPKPPTCWICHKTEEQSRGQTQVHICDYGEEPTENGPYVKLHGRKKPRGDCGVDMCGDG
jgi:hypothetical protein